jgi:hypothetical protein
MKRFVEGLDRGQRTLPPAGMALSVSISTELGPRIGMHAETQDGEMPAQAGSARR